MKARHLWVAAGFGMAALSSRGEILLKGVAITNGEPLFSLYSVEEQTSKWVSLGQSFSGFRVLSFDPLTESLVLANGELRQTVRLQSVAIKDSSTEDAKARLRMLSGLELAYELAKRGDMEIGQILKSYQGIAARLGQLVVATGGSETPETAAAVKFLSAQRDELRAQVEKVAAAKAAVVLAAPVKP